MVPDFPARIGRYDVVGVLGSGRLGTVYKAFDQAFARVVCVRVLSPEILADPPRLERIRRDFKASAALVHDNVLRVFEEGQDGDLVYTVAEYVDGGGLADRMKASRLTLGEAIRVTQDVADGLGAAHRAGLVHGDLNPRNVLVSKDLSVVKIGEFGTADATAAGGTARTTALASARIASQLYRAPELAGSDGTATVRSDIYSLGVIAYEAMTGKLPIGKFSLPSDVNNQIPLALDPIVLRCLATDPSQRYQSVAELVAEFDKIKEVVGLQLLNEVKRLSGGRLFREKGTPKPPRRRPAGIPRYLGLAAVAVLAVAVTVAILVRGRGGVLSRTDTPNAAAARPAPAAAAQPPATPPPAAPPLAAPAPASAPLTAPPSAQSPLASSELPRIPVLAAPMTAAPPLSATVPGPPAPSPSSAAPSERRAASAPAAPVASPPTPTAAGRAGAAQAGSLQPAIPPETPPRVQAPREAEQSAGALFTEAQALIKKGRDLDARTRLALVGEKYSQTRWFVSAMMVKIGLEDRLALREPDPVIHQTVPASVQTKRLLTQRAPQHVTSEAALWQLGEFYDGIQQYGAAVEAYVQLATRFPNTRLDAWFRAGEITAQRLKKRADARAAYLNVPATSPRFAEAQERARKLAGR